MFTKAFNKLSPNLRRIVAVFILLLAPIDWALSVLVGTAKTIKDFARDLFFFTFKAVPSEYADVAKIVRTGGTL